MAHQFVIEIRKHDHNSRQHCQKTLADWLGFTTERAASYEAPVLHACSNMPRDNPMLLKGVMFRRLHLLPKLHTSSRSFPGLRG